MLGWISDTIFWLYMDLVSPLLDIRFWWNWLFNGNIPLALSLLIINSLFLILRLFDNGAGAGANKDWNSGPSLVFQTGLIIANASLVAVDASMRGWL